MRLMRLMRICTDIYVVYTVCSSMNVLVLVGLAFVSASASSFAGKTVYRQYTFAATNERFAPEAYAEISKPVVSLLSPRNRALYLSAELACAKTGLLCRLAESYCVKTVYCGSPIVYEVAGIDEPVKEISAIEKVKCWVSTFIERYAIHLSVGFIALIVFSVLVDLFGSGLVEYLDAATDGLKTTQNGAAKSSTSSRRVSPQNNSDIDSPQSSETDSFSSLKVKKRVRGVSLGKSPNIVSPVNAPTATPPVNAPSVEAPSVKAPSVKAPPPLKIIYIPENIVTPLYIAPPVSVPPVSVPPVEIIYIPTGIVPPLYIAPPATHESTADTVESPVNTDLPVEAETVPASILPPVASVRTPPLANVRHVLPVNIESANTVTPVDTAPPVNIPPPVTTLRIASLVNPVNPVTPVNAVPPANTTRPVPPANTARPVPIIPLSTLIALSKASGFDHSNSNYWEPRDPECLKFELYMDAARIYKRLCGRMRLDTPRYVRQRVMTLEGDQRIRWIDGLTIIARYLKHSPVWEPEVMVVVTSFTRRLLVDLIARSSKAEFEYTFANKSPEKLHEMTKSDAVDVDLWKKVCWMTFIDYVDFEQSRSRNSLRLA